ncbi:MAG: penicillin-binding protein activator, partial [Pseudomonadota bacterium]
MPAARTQIRIQTRTDAVAGLPTPCAGQGNASPARGVAGRLGRGVARLAAAAGLLALAACATGSDRAATPDAPSSPSAPAAPSTPVTGPVPVALLLPLGAAEERDAASARAIENGARLALQGAGGSAVRLSVIDTRGTPEGATSAANTAIAGGARLILGPLFGRNASAVAGPAGAAGINVLSLSTDVTVAGPPVWITGFTPSDEVDRILGYAAGRGIQRLGVYAPDIPYGNAALEAARRLAPRHGIALVAAESYPRSFQDIERTAPLFAEAARASGADAVLLPDFGQGLTTASTYVDFVGLPQPGVRYLGIGQWEAPATLREPTLTGGWFAGADVGAVDAIARRYSARYGERPPFLA